jgi:phosphatidylserine decarboxylase
MKFHKEGWPTLIVVILFSVIILLVAKLLFGDYPILFAVAIGISVFLLTMVLQFFRNPYRTIDINEKNILSPCDGKVVVIEEIEETEFLNQRCRQISIFMSPVNVHNNRYPVGGKIAYYKYHPGKYLVAWHPKSSTDNERTTVAIKMANNTMVMFRQIAGAMARRIVFYGKEGEVVDQGKECGFIKFGSRVDLLLPLESKIEVALNQKVQGGRTVIATLP